MSAVKEDATRPELSAAAMKAIVTAVLDVLECPVCYQELRAPIYQCNNGHPVCASCRPRVRCCPVCKAWMYQVRALALEKIVRELPRPCRFAADGCAARLSGSARALHERACPHRPARCAEALIACQWRGPLTEARGHLAEQHALVARLHPAMHGRFSFRVGCAGQEKFLEDAAEGLLFRCLIRCERGRLHFLCHALAPAERAARYLFRVLVTHQCSQRRLSFEGPVVSVLQSVTRTVDRGQGLWVERDWLVKACTCRQQRHCFDTTWHLGLRPDLDQTEALRQALVAKCLRPQEKTK